MTQLVTLDSIRLDLFLAHRNALIHSRSSAAGRMHPGRRTLPQIFAAPLLIAALSATRPLSALLGDDAWDLLS
ncbi:MAG TPA: hypothetical protein VFE34_23720 [Dongiaceae bacterium]|nr:hypothetical protein [Dongiaceae bacterium]